MSVYACNTGARFEADTGCLEVCVKPLNSGQMPPPCAGDKRLFIRFDELEAAWDLYTPLLHEIDTKKVKSVDELAVGL